MRKHYIKKMFFFAALTYVVICTSLVYSHCQIPCGIYNDPLRFDMISEDITTIEKSMKSIISLSEAEKPDFNQIVRWVQNKEEHADRISQVITYYFMAQRIKPAEKADTEAYAKYVKKLVLLHEMLVCSMKSKQTTDMKNVEKLRSLLNDFRSEYLGEQSVTEHKH